MTVPFMANTEGPQASCRWDSRQGDHQGEGILLANRWIVNKNSSSLRENDPFSEPDKPLFFGIGNDCRTPHRETPFPVPAIVFQDCERGGLSTDKLVE